MIETREIVELKTAEDVDRFISEHHKSIVFKAGTCWITDHAWEVLQKSIKPYPHTPLAFITVVRYRDASNHIAKITGIRHQSPQILIMQGQTVLYERNNMMIEEVSLQHTLRKYFGA